MPACVLDKSIRILSRIKSRLSGPIDIESSDPIFSIDSDEEDDKLALSIADDDRVSKRLDQNRDSDLIEVVKNDIDRPMCPECGIGVYHYESENDIPEDLKGKLVDSDNADY